MYLYQNLNIATFSLQRFKLWSSRLPFIVCMATKNKQKQKLPKELKFCIIKVLSYADEVPSAKKVNLKMPEQKKKTDPNNLEKR